MLKPIFENIPDELKHNRQWVNWKYVSRKEGDKPTKPPCMPSGKFARTDDPSTWSHFITVKAAADQFDGVGYVLNREEEIVAFDFDCCRCPALPEINPECSGLGAVLPEIADHVRRLNTYAELSPSAKGVRVFAKGKFPVDGKRKGQIEAYQSGRYVTVTGHFLDGLPRIVKPRQREIDAFYQQVFDTPEEPPKQNKSSLTESSSGDWRAMIEKAFESKSGSEIRRLWSGDFSAYPSQSEGDMALCNYLAFWLGRDAAVIDSAFRESGLFRKKWDEKHGISTYGEITIKKAIERCTASYGDGALWEVEEQAKPSPEEWSEPIPFNDFSLLPSFPVETIPGVCGEMVATLVDSCQVDAGLPGSMVLAVLSTAIGARVRVILDSHSEQGNLYLLSVLDSGNRKSEVKSQLAAPLSIFQKAQQESMAPVIREAENKQRILQKRLDKLEKKAAGKDNPEEREILYRECNDLLKEIEEKPISAKPTYLVDDITLEKLGGIMCDNEERGAVLSAEGGIFKLIGGLYSNGHSNIDLILKAHTGDAWSSDRVSRDSQSMMHPALTLGLAVQPNVLEEIGRNPEFRGRGLSARFLYAWCQSKAGYRTLQAAPVSALLTGAYHRLIISLMEIGGTHELRLTPEAQAIWNEFYADVELLLRPGANLQHLVDWGSKLPGAVARIAGLLHFAENGPDGIGQPISFHSMRNACVMGGYFTEHAKAAFGIMKEDVRLTVARKILSYIKRCRLERLKARSLFDHTSCTCMDEIIPGITILIERGYLREVKRAAITGRGRPESSTYEVNPKVYSTI